MSLSTVIITVVLKHLTLSFALPVGTFSVNSMKKRVKHGEGGEMNFWLHCEYIFQGTVHFLHFLRKAIEPVCGCLPFVPSSPQRRERSVYGGLCIGSISTDSREKTDTCWLKPWQPGQRDTASAATPGAIDMPGQDKDKTHMSTCCMVPPKRLSTLALASVEL